MFSVVPRAKHRERKKRLPSCVVAEQGVLSYPDNQVRPEPLTKTEPGTKWRMEGARVFDSPGKVELRKESRWRYQGEKDTGL